MNPLRNNLEAFRVTDGERLELGLLAKARGITKSDLLRDLVRDAAEKEIRGEKERRKREASAGGDG